MRYVSTRGQAPVLDFADAMLAGLARDGGLYVPESWPTLAPEDIRALAGVGYAEAAYRITRPFVGDAIEVATYRAIVDATYANFTHAAVAPLKQLAPNLWLLELFHGPTLAFKDYAMQLLGNLFNHVLSARGRRVTIVGATSGDTGSAAIEACKGHDAIDVVILYPHNRVSEVQRRQMTTVNAPNVHAFAVNGTFDDCQAILKALFNDGSFRDEISLSGVNSINWARILGQVVYYMVAGAALGAPDRRISFAVPTGNFGNIYAGYVASRMGLPVAQLVLATNANDILSRTLATGTMKRGEVVPSLSPSMDIQVASNFERMLFDLLGRDGARVAQQMAAFADTGELPLSPLAWREATGVFTGFRLDDAGTVAEIRDTFEATGEVLDPHTAIAVAGARAAHADAAAPGAANLKTGGSAAAAPMVALATAHPAKFSDAVTRAIGRVPALPPHMADLLARKETYTVIDNDVRAVKAAIRTCLAQGVQA
ncbi:MAG: threonine synthase [Alphaproteobacteria bacterium]